MSSGISSLLDISRRSLLAQTQAIRVLGDNITNVNTPGYSKRTAQLTADKALGLQLVATGTGVGVDRITRAVDSFVNRELSAKIKERAAGEVREEFLRRAQSPFSLEGDDWHLGARLNSFFSSLEDLATDPASIPLRTQVIQEGELLVSSVKTAYNDIADLQREADNRLMSLVNDVNRITGEMATINVQISSSETQNQQNLTLRDKRDKLVEELNELLDVNTVELEDGTMTVYTDDGFALVNGTASKDIEYTRGPSFGSGAYPPGLDGESLGHIVYNYGDDATRSDIDLTNVLRNGGGEIGGLLSLRGTQQTTDTHTFQTNGDLVDIAVRIEAIARDLLINFNQTYQGADEGGGGGTFQPSSGDLDGNSPTFDGLFTFTGLTDANADNRLTEADLNAFSAANQNFYGFASVLDFKISDPRTVAAALDFDAAAGSTSFASGDSRNIDSLIALRDQERTFAVPTAASVFTTTASIEDIYNTTVSFAGTLYNQAQSNLAVREDQEKLLKEVKSGLSGVSLDEEFAQLILFQKAFEASARMIRVGDQLLNDVMNILG